MTSCPCGLDVRLRAARVRLDRRNGVMHWIEHRDGSKVCPSGPWSSVALKPYPKFQEEREYAKLCRRWDALARLDEVGK